MLNGKIISEQNNDFLLALPGGQSLRVAKGDVPSALARVGEEVWVRFTAPRLSEPETRDLLNELLKTGI